MADNQAEIPDDLTKLKVADLKRLCEDKGLPTTGKKADLVERLETAQDAEVGVDTSVGLDDTGADQELEELLKEDDEAEQQVTSEKENTTSPKPIKKIVLSEVSEEPVKTQTKTEAERIAERANRFGGATSEQSKKALRAARFGIEDSSSKTSVSGGSLEKLKQRADRFGAVTSTELAKVDSVNKLKQRAERFGQTTAPALVKEEGTDKLKERANRFGVVTSSTLTKTEQQERLLKRKQKFGAITLAGGDADEAKKKRAERFGTTT